MATLFSETWTGDDDDPWPTANWETADLTSSSTATIQGNEGELNPTGASYVRARLFSKSPSLTGFDLTCTVRFGTSGEQYHGILFRTDGVWSGVYGETAQNGYTLRFTSSEIQILSSVASVRTIINNVSKTWGTSAWNIRIRAEGSSIKTKSWQGSEPGTWEFDITNADHASGILAAASVNGSGATARPWYLDDLVVASLPAVYEQTDYRFYNDDGDTI